MAVTNLKYKNYPSFNKMADKNNKSNDEKNLLELIKKVFKEEFAQQEKTLLVEVFQ